MDLVARILEAAPEHLYPGGTVLCEIGDNRAALERRYPRLPLTWPLPQVFLYRPRSGAASQKPSRRAQAR
jgi:methylase of polypeptide subunit release factors